MLPNTPLLMIFIFDRFGLRSGIMIWMHEKRKKKKGGMGASCPLIDDFRGDSPDNPEHGAPIHGEMKGRITDTSIVCVGCIGRGAVASNDVRMHQPSFFCTESSTLHFQLAL